jgi:hypothetical protein
VKFLRPPIDGSTISAERRVRQTDWQKRPTWFSSLMTQSEERNIKRTGGKEFERRKQKMKDIRKQNTQEMKERRKVGRKNEERKIEIQRKKKTRKKGNLKYVLLIYCLLHICRTNECMWHEKCSFFIQKHLYSTKTSLKRK